MTVEKSHRYIRRWLSNGRNFALVLLSELFQCVKQLCWRVHLWCYS